MLSRLLVYRAEFGIEDERSLEEACLSLSLSFLLPPDRNEEILLPSFFDDFDFDGVVALLLLDELIDLESSAPGRARGATGGAIDNRAVCTKLISIPLTHRERERGRRAHKSFVPSESVRGSLLLES